MGPPQYIERFWRGDGRAEVHLDIKEDETRGHSLQHHRRDPYTITCYLSACYIRELERRSSASDVGSCSEPEPERRENYTDAEVEIPPGVPEELWQGWLEYWQAWKEVYVNLSWVHKHRTMCKPDFVSWYDSYLEDYPWVFPAITEELWPTKTETSCNDTCSEVSCEKDQINSLVNANEDPEIMEELEQNCTSDTDHVTYQETISPNVDSVSEASKSFCESMTENVLEADGTEEEVESGTGLSLETEEENEKKLRMDAMYEKHSQQRYWVHLRSFLLESGVEANNEIEQYFLRRASLTFARESQPDERECWKESDSVVNSEIETQQVQGHIYEEGVSENSKECNGEADYAKIHENVLQTTCEELCNIPPSCCLPAETCKAKKNESNYVNGTEAETERKAHKFKPFIQDGDDDSRTFVDALDGNINADMVINCSSQVNDSSEGSDFIPEVTTCTDISNDSVSQELEPSVSQSSTSFHNSAPESSSPVTKTDNGNLYTQSASAAKKKKKKKNKKRYDAGIGWALNFVNRKKTVNCGDGDQNITEVGETAIYGNGTSQDAYQEPEKEIGSKVSKPSSTSKDEDQKPAEEKDTTVNSIVDKSVIGDEIFAKHVAGKINYAVEDQEPAEQRDVTVDDAEEPLNSDQALDMDMVDKNCFPEKLDVHQNPAEINEEMNYVVEDQEPAQQRDITEDIDVDMPLNSDQTLATDIVDESNCVPENMDVDQNSAEINTEVNNGGYNLVDSVITEPMEETTKKQCIPRIHPASVDSPSNTCHTKAKTKRGIKRKWKKHDINEFEDCQEKCEKDKTDPSKTQSLISRFLQSSYWRIFKHRTLEHHINIVASLFSGGIDLMSPTIKWPFLSHCLDSRQAAKIDDNSTKDASGVESEREEMTVEEQLYEWLCSHPSMATNLPPQEILHHESHLMPSEITTDADDRPAERAYYEVKTEVQGEVSQQSLQLLFFQEEYGWDEERAVWRELTSGLRNVNYSDPDQDMPSDLPHELYKYWAQRYRFFIKFDEGIKLDNESWFSVTPEMIAVHQASRCQCDTVVDAFCGAGGNAIQLAFTCNNVIAIDRDPEKIALARHNAEVYQVSDRIQFIIGDFFQHASSLKADVVFLSPPWGGIDYLDSPVYDVMALGGIMRCDHLMKTARFITPNIALYLPRNSNLFQILELVEAGGSVDIESSYLGRKKKALTAYFGSLVGGEY